MNFHTERVSRNRAVDATTATVFMDADALEVLDLAMGAAQYSGSDFHDRDAPEKRAFGLLAGVVTALIFACRPTVLTAADVERGVSASGIAEVPLFQSEQMHWREDGGLRGVSVRLNYTALETLDIALAAARFGGPMLYVASGEHVDAVQQLAGSIMALCALALSENVGGADTERVTSSTPPEDEVGRSRTLLQSSTSGAQVQASDRGSRQAATKGESA